jgi:hypothetical protein
MLLLLEILLTILAYRRGWKGLAVLPGTLTLGFSLGLHHWAPQVFFALLPVLIALEFLGCAALLVMVSHKPRMIGF